MGNYNTCANARPLQGRLFASIYACPYASYNTGKIDSENRCLECEYYSDLGTAVSVVCETFRATIFMNRLIDLKVRKAGKLFKMIWKCELDNEKAIDKIGQYLASMFILHNVEEKNKLDKKWVRLYQLWQAEEKKRRRA